MSSEIANVDNHADYVEVYSPSNNVTDKLFRDMAPAVKYANMMSKCTFLPEGIRGNEGNCFMVIQYAIAWKLPPFAVAQCVSNIKGKMMFEGKIIAAAINNSPKIKHNLNWRFDGTGETRKCTCYGTIKGEDEEREVTVQLNQVRSANQQWVSNPDQMMRYFSARVWARSHLPDVLAGVYAPDEFDEKDQKPSRPSQNKSINTQPKNENKRKNAEKWAQEFIDKLQKFKDASSMHKYINSVSNVLGRFEKNYKDLADKVNNAMQLREDELHQQEVA